MNNDVPACPRCNGRMSHQYDTEGGGYRWCLTCGNVVWDAPPVRQDDDGAQPRRSYEHGAAHRGRRL